jgi:hypothetical protein
MEHSIPQLMVISASALTIISLLSMLAACVLLLISLFNFYKAKKTKLRSDYSRAFRLSGNGFLVLGLLQVLLLAFVDSGTKVNATYAAVFFILFGAAASFIGEKLKPKMPGRK